MTESLDKVRPEEAAVMVLLRQRLKRDIEERRKIENKASVSRLLKQSIRRKQEKGESD